MDEDSSILPVESVATMGRPTPGNSIAIRASGGDEEDSDVDESSSFKY